MLSLFCCGARRPTALWDRLADPCEAWALSAPRIISTADSSSLSLPFSGRRLTGTAAATTATAAAAPLAGLASAKPPTARRGSTAYSLWDPVDGSKYDGLWRDNTVSDPEPEAGRQQGLASAAPSESEQGEPEPTERKATSHLEGAAAFRQPPDCELEVDGVVFPVHSAIVCNASTLLDCLLASFLPTEDDEGEEALEAEGDGAVEQATPPLPRLVLKRAGPAAEGEPESPLTADKLEAFLRHIYGVSRIQVEGVNDLLQMVDYLQAFSVKSACDRELASTTKVDCTRGSVPLRIMELASRHKLPCSMAQCMAGTAVMISNGGQMQTSLFSSTYRGLACCTSPEQASVYLDLISEELKFQLLRATVHAAYQSEFHFHKPGELFKLADGIADALQTLPRWGAPPPGNAPNLTGYCLAITEPGAGSSEPPKTIPDQALYLQGKSDLFVSRADLEIELDSVRFPVHSAIMARTCSALDALLANRPPAKPGKRLRILVQPAVPAAPVGQAAGEPGAGAAHGGAPAGAAGQGTAAAQGGAPAVMPGAGPAAVAPTQPAAGGGAAVAAAPAQPAITPEKLLCFLCHCYRPDLSIDQEAVPLLQLADIFGAAKMREAAAQTLTDKLERVCKTLQQPVQTLNYLPLACRYKLRRMAGLCAGLLIHYLVQYRDLDSACAMFDRSRLIAECLNPMLYVMARKLKDVHNPPFPKTLKIFG